jgi:hypothetical protein
MLSWSGSLAVQGDESGKRKLGAEGRANRAENLDQCTYYLVIAVPDLWRRVLMRLRMCWSGISRKRSRVGVLKKVSNGTVLRAVRAEDRQDMWRLLSVVCRAWM